MALIRARMILVIAAVFGSLMFFLAQPARAVPSFARQTGMTCNACHTVFPELTPFGRTFKMGGYTLSKSDKPYQWPPPIAGMALVSFTHTSASQPPGSISNHWANLTNTSTNNAFYLPEALSIFYAGRIYDRIGAFIQGTYDGVEDNSLLDNTDVRFADKATFYGKSLVYGITVNNNPTLEDVWNTTPAFGFPYASSAVAPTPAAATLIDGTLGQQVGGAGAYLFWNNLVYLNATVYRTDRKGITEPLGAGTVTDTVVDGAMPYWRLALQHQMGNHSFELGTYGLFANVFPSGLISGPTDSFTDIAFDAQYQYIRGKHIFSAATTFIHEKQNWDASFPLGITANESDNLNTFKINLNYYYRADIGTLGGTAGFFSTFGGNDMGLYAPDPVDGSRTGSPDSNGFILEADYVLLEKYKFSLQYMIYNKFNGAGSNYDGFGRNASDNNTLYLLAWLMF
jgi:hypothetical protein